MKQEHRQLLEQLRGARRVLVVDDHPSFRRCARAVLTAEGFEVLGEAEDGASAVALAAELEPDLVVLDIQLPDSGRLRGRVAAAGARPRACDRARLEPRPVASTGR